MKHRVVFFGSSQFGLPSLNALLALQQAELVGIVSQPAKPSGRKGRPNPTPVTVWAEQHDIPLLTPTSMRSDEFVQSVIKLKPDTFIVAAYGLIFPQSVLDVPKYGCINLHASLLSKYRGASPIAASILHGESVTGITYMVMDSGIDTGPILQQNQLNIRKDETTPELETRLASTAAEHLPDLLQQYWAGILTPRPQTGPSSYAPMLTSEDGRATWESATKLERKIRAFQPWPGVWTTWNGQRFKIISARVQLGSLSDPSGTIISVPGTTEWGIVCGDGLLIPSKVQVAGKKPVLAKSVPGSYPFFLNSRFG